MKISASFLSITENQIENLKKLDETNINYLHVDVMDGEFVQNKSWNYEFFSKILKDTKKPKDVHLMVSNIKEYIDVFKHLNPYYITFHHEASFDTLNIIKYIHNLNFKAGLSIKPSTSVDEIMPYLSTLDLVLVMSVEPGKGGQDFIESSVEKINELARIKKEYNYDYVIEVDGGINNDNYKLCSNADILVIGSYITKSDNYKDRVDSILLR